MGKEVEFRGVNELREMFLSFFESKDHLRMKSFSLVPHNDNSLLLINSGMAPLKPYFTGQEIPPRRRVTTCQKCIRTGDIENVGKTARHGTFFEMLGNFSFGDYFKTEAIHWSWEFLTEVVGLDPDRLYPSVYVDDDEAFEIWNKEIGIAPERIFRFGKEDNFWEHGAGPCGPCSEIYYDRGEKYGCGEPGCTVGCECDRYMEIWNNVFTQFNNDGNNNYTELEQKNIDTGMGLERLAVVVQDVDSIFDVDTLFALRNHVSKLCGKEYKQDEQTDISMRVVTDHIRSVTFMVSDGIMPSNEGRGYVLRRLLRRAARHGRLLGIEDKFLADLATTVIEGSKDGYPELDEKRKFILEVIQREEENFNNTIDSGLSILKEMQEKLKAENKTVLDGSSVFKLYDTYGFPVDLTAEILEDDGMSIDEEGFKAEMEEQRKKAREARNATNYMGAEETVFDTIDPGITSEFTGYDGLEGNSSITVMTVAHPDDDKNIYIDDEIVEALSEGEHGTVILPATPFYATMGGQEGDTGVITGTDGEFTVTSTIPLKGGKVGHVGYVSRGMIRNGENVHLAVDSSLRADTCKNHSATHLLHAALKNVLGSHVEQHGSLVSPDRLRFDFSHFQAMTPEEIRKTEELVNAEIAKGEAVSTDIMSIDEARKTGATALFGEKYGEKVRVVTMGDFSKEFCGGTHVKNTGNIALFKIISESGIAAGVRRIEALTGRALREYYDKLETEINEASEAAKTDSASLVTKIEAMQEELKKLRSENESMKAKLAGQALGDSVQEADVKGVKLFTAKLSDVEGDALLNLGDKLKTKADSCVVLLAGEKEGKVSLLAMATDAAVNAGAHAGNLIKELAPIVGGGGGGRPNMARAGGKDPAGIDKMLAEAEGALSGQIK